MTNNFDIISIGSCTLDCIITVKDILRFELFEKELVKKYTAIEYSRKLNVEDMRFVPGGSGANIAADCAMLGLKSAYIGVLGDDFSAHICIDDLKKRGVNTSYIKQISHDTTAFSVILKTEWGKDRSILAYKGANNHLTPDDVHEDLFENLKAFAWTSLTSENGCQAIYKAITLTKQNGGMVFAAPSMSILKHNPNWAEKLISASDVVSLNFEEAQEFTGEKKKTLMFEKFLDKGISIISITDGAEGSIISDGELIINSGIYHAGKPVIDTTGAGDAFMSAIILSKLNNYALEKMSKLATAMSYLESKEVGVRVGVPSNLQELESFIEINSLKQVISKIT